jgi:hypothetical protein
VVSGLENFRGAEDIDKSRVVIRNHPVERFIDHSRAQKQKIPANYREAETMIRNLLLQASHEKAIGQADRVRALIDHKEETFYFRFVHWQFRIIRSPKNRDAFILKTVVWLNEKAYRACFK